MGNLKGKIAIVTGAGRGMGHAIAQEIAKNGAFVILNDLNEEAVKKAAENMSNFNGEAVSDVGDVSNHEYVDEMISRAIERFGTVDILVNNAGVLRPTPFIDITEDEWDFVVTGNLKTTFLCSQSVIPIMQKKEWGRIINISSSAGKNISTMGGAHYTAAKAAVLGLTRHMAKEVAKFGITVNAICPGVIETNMTKTADEFRPGWLEATAKLAPIGRIGQPEEMASVVVWLCSQGASYVTGHASNRRELKIDVDKAMFDEYSLNFLSNIKRYVNEVDRFNYISNVDKFSKETLSEIKKVFRNKNNHSKITSCIY